MRLILVPSILSSLSLSRSPTLTLSHSVFLSHSLSLYPLTFFLIFLSQRRWWSLLVILSPVLQLFVYFYKKIRFRKEIIYEQKLQQAVMSGVRNAYRPIIIFIGFLGIGVSACVHFYFSEMNLNSPVSKDVIVESTFAPIFWMIIIFSFMIWISFLRNPKLRFEWSWYSEIVTIFV